MRIQFCGANRTVTGSCHLVEVNGVRVILDLGMFQGRRDEARRFNEWLPADIKSAHALILSHGHFDHCGKIPVVTRMGFAAPIYCTAATLDVARIVLEDAAEIQVEDAEYLNRRAVEPGAPPVRPLYGPSDIPPVIRLMKRVPYAQRTDLGNDVGFTFFDAGHILGSAYVVLDWIEKGGSTRRSLLFTADIGRYSSPIIRDPEPLTGVMDYVISESTYGGRMHAPVEQVGPQLLDAVKTCIARRGRLLVPAFAVGRTQVILWYLQRFIQAGEISAIPIYVDSPMGVQVSRVHMQHRDNYDAQTLKAIGEQDLFGHSRVHFASSVKESKAINADHGPCVIVASSPTCEFGRILHHLAHTIERPQDMIVFVGFTPRQTLGRRLQDGEKRVRIYDRWYDVRCETRTIHGLSAHADSEELVRFLRPTITKQTQFFMVHGEAPQAEALAARLLAEGAGQAIIPALETSAVGPGWSVVTSGVTEPKGDD